MCVKYDIQTIIEESGVWSGTGSKVYTYYNTSLDIIVKHHSEIMTQLGVESLEKQQDFLELYLIPKICKPP